MHNHQSKQSDESYQAYRLVENERLQGKVKQRTKVGELIGYDFEGIGLDRLYQASDLLWKHHDELEAHCYQRELSLFQMGETITLFDLRMPSLKALRRILKQQSEGAQKKSVAIVCW